MQKTILLCCLSVFCFGKLQAEVEKLESSHQPLFVSLGSHCEVAMHIRHNQMRTAAFPFDWLLTFDYQGFILTFEDEFAFFWINPIYTSILLEILLIQNTILTFDMIGLIWILKNIF